MALFPEISDEDSVLRGSGHAKRSEDFSKLLSSGSFISDKD
jgi:hypothetical protein